MVRSSNAVQANEQMQISKNKHYVKILLLRRALFYCKLGVGIHDNGYSYMCGVCLENMNIETVFYA